MVNFESKPPENQQGGENDIKRVNQHYTTRGNLFISDPVCRFEP